MFGGLEVFRSQILHLRKRSIVLLSHKEKQRGSAVTYTFYRTVVLHSRIPDEKPHLVTPSVDPEGHSADPQPQNILPVDLQDAVAHHETRPVGGRARLHLTHPGIGIPLGSAQMEPTGTLGGTGYQALSQRRLVLLGLRTHRSLHIGRLRRPYFCAARDRLRLGLSLSSAVTADTVIMEGG
ncbi:hypothetical protein J6590_055233 [Homalodisca vitripennis]|nr:hypothetical protein J6590_055233 [Homalodisca vitripennis]